MKKIFFFSLVVFFTELLIIIENPLSLELTPEEKHWIEQNKSLRFSEVEWEPLSCINKYPEYNGIIAEYLNIISEKTGIKMIFIKSNSWQEVIDKFIKRDIDFIPALALNDDIGTDVAFTNSYISFPLIIATRPSVDFISYTDELAGKKVGVGKGYSSYHFLKKNYPNIEIVTSYDVDDGIKMLYEGEVDAFVGHIAVVKDVIKKSGLNLRIAGKTEYIFDHRIGLHPEQKIAAIIFNKVLNEITPEEHNRIYNKWIKMDIEPVKTIDYSLTWKIIISSILLISIVVTWNRKVVKEKEQIKILFKDLEKLKNELEKKNYTLNKLAVTDQLTGLYNRIKLNETLNNEMKYYERYNNSFGIILMDIDHFKSINDTYGHPTGDTILVTISKLLKSNIRNTDTLGRWGGEEFMIICPGIDKGNLNKMAEKLRIAINNYKFEDVNNATASIGGTVFQNNDDLKKLMKRADEALYMAKGNGRNKVVIK